MTYEEFRAAVLQLSEFDASYQEAILHAAQGQSPDVLLQTLEALITAHAKLVGLDQAPSSAELQKLQGDIAKMKRDVRKIREEDEHAAEETAAQKNLNP